MKIKEIPKCPCKDNPKENFIRPNIVLYNDEDWNSSVSDE